MKTMTNRVKTTKVNWSRFLITLVLITILASACSATSQPLLDGTQAVELVDLAPCIYKLNKTKYQAECGNLVVSENRFNPDARLTSLPVIRVLALNENPSEPIFWLAGGPGGTNLKFLALDELIENHDIVLVGYRGVDGSVALDCPEIDQAIKGIGDNLLSAESTAYFGQGITDCAERLQSEGIELDGYSIPEVIKDIEAARKALGYDRVNLFSASFGTRIAMIYAWMYPDSLHRSAMVAVNPPGHFVWEPDDLDALIRYDAELCEQNLECSSRTDDLVETIRTVSHNVPDRWLLIPIDSGKVRYITHLMLFHRGTAATIFDAYLAAEEGDPSGLALLSLSHNLMTKVVSSWGHWLAFGSLDYDPDRNWIDEMDPPDSILGSPVSLLVGAAAQQNGGWPVAPMPDEFRTVQPTTVDTLLVSGIIDYSTPVQVATEELLPFLTNGEQVILSEFGHFNDVWGFQPEATRHLLATFFDTGEIDDSLFTYEPMNFDVGLLSLPFIAKALMITIIMIPLLLVVLVRRIVRSVKRRNATRLSPKNINAGI